MSTFPSASKVQICGINKHECGYCKASTTGSKPKNSSVSYGFVAKSMTVEDYQSIMLTGWRRSGTYFYKPIMHKTCCPQYTIRLRVNEHTQSKSQKKVYKNVKKFLSEAPDDSSQTTEDNLKISPMFTFTKKGKVLEAESTPTTPSTRNALRLTVELERPSVTAEKYELYKRYQIDVHHDKPEDLSEQGFRRFLVDSPLTAGGAAPLPPVSSPTTANTKANTNSNKPSTSSTPASNNTEGAQYGSFHQLYRLNGQLIAVGVVDILPLGLSSVYLFYDNNYKQLSLGKYTALREIEYCRERAFEYYFMGFYIHTCEKMRYKGEYKPSDLLCPTTLQWFPLAQCGKILDKFNFSPFEPVLAARRALVDADVGVKPSGNSGNSARGSNEEGAGVNAITDDTSVTATHNVNADIPAADATPSATVTATDNTNHGTTNSSMAVPDAASVTQEGSESEEEEGSDSDSDSDSELPASPLDEFAPIFDYNPNTSANTSVNTTLNTTNTSTTTPPNTASLNSIPLDVGIGRPIALSDLKPESILHLQPFLLEWVQHVGAASAARIAVSLI